MQHRARHPARIKVRRPLLLGLLISLCLVVACAAYAHWPQAPLPRGTAADRIIINKSARSLSLVAKGKVLREYTIALGSSPIGEKEIEGDGKTPEGIYHIDQRNPHSQYHLALHISYPTPQQIRNAKQKRQSPGGMVMIHGLPDGAGFLGRLHRLVDWTAGCVAVTNEEIEEIWRVVPDGTVIEIRA